MSGLLLLQAIWGTDESIEVIYKANRENSLLAVCLGLGVGNEQHASCDRLMAYINNASR